MNPAVRIAMAMHDRPGSIAVLLGSGASRAAKIPTGYEVVEDLARRIAAAQAQDPATPLQWFQETFGKPAQYSEIIQDLANSKEQRVALLAGYFEPDGKIPEPTAAHRAIAELAAGGYLKVILTTNFDRLMEAALVEQGIEPVVISNPSQAAGAVPVSQSGVVVVKVNGDYKDPGFLNTQDELAEYHGDLANFVARILEEHGLLISGWSAEHDTALLSLIEARQSRRFESLWAGRGEASDAIKEISTRQQIPYAPVGPADEFFGGLSDSVASLARLGEGTPLSIGLAVEATKQQIEAGPPFMRLHDSLMREAKHIQERLHTDAFPIHSGGDVDLEARFHALLGEGRIFAAISGTTAFWVPNSTPHLERPFRNASSYNRTVSPWNSALEEAMVLPAAMAWWAAGTSMIARDEWESVTALLQLNDMGLPGDRDWAPFAFEPNRICGKIKEGIPDAKRNLFWLRERFKGAVVECVKDVLGSEGDAAQAFDNFDAIVNLHRADHAIQEKRRPHYAAGPWLSNHHGDSALKIMESDIEARGTNWGPLETNLFGGKLERVNAAIEGLGEYRRGHWAGFGF